jgi:transcriptional regulator with XRE-family HTH domain
MPPSPTAHPVDIHVGAQLRMHRRQIGASQSDLAAALGLTFQQVQKYERGATRISASMLFAAAGFLKIPIETFFHGLPSNAGAVDVVAIARTTQIGAFLTTPEGFELASLLPRLPSRRRREILAFVRALAEAAPQTPAHRSEIGEVERSCDDPHGF